MSKFIHGHASTPQQIYDRAVDAISHDVQAFEFLRKQMAGRRAFEVPKDELTQIVENVIRFAIQNRSETIL